MIITYHKRPVFMITDPEPLTMIFVVLNLLLLSHMIPTTKSDTPNFLSWYCTNANTSLAATFQANLNTLFSSLSLNATDQDGFYNASAGSTSAVYGLLLCRGDVDASLCQSCVKAAVGFLSQNCSRATAAVVWYDQCMVRYSNTSIIGKLDGSIILRLTNTNNVTSNVTGFEDVVASTMNELQSVAADGGSSKKFATKEAFIGGSQPLYVLEQCTPDLSVSDCSRCLAEITQQLLGQSCCRARQGARILFPSCNIRYEIYQFYSIQAPAPAPSVPAVAPPPPLEQPAKNTTTTPARKKGSSMKHILVVVLPVVIAVSLIAIVVFCFMKRKRKQKWVSIQENENVADEFTTVEPLQYDLSTLQAATNLFSDDNKIGEGGFGSVYKGTLPKGQEIAVKRLSRSSGQGALEFKNEAMLVAKLQHRNLVRVLGFCVAGEEKLLVYEFVPNKSLDYFLFDPEKRRGLDWSKRYKIILGVARGMLYLHEDSRLKIIHRDLKASNVLLDVDMNPKVSDFGMARIFGVDQTHAKTNRVVGTYGYMSPEYAMHGQFSVKSDVYSFGVLMLEIISGIRNSRFNKSGFEDLLSYAWKHWRDETPMEFVDPTLRDSCSRTEVMRCIHLGLLCIQEDVDDRPTMATVVLMLNSYSTVLPLPALPSFTSHSRGDQSVVSDQSTSKYDQSTSKSMQWSVNEASVTQMDAR